MRVIAATPRGSVLVAVGTRGRAGWLSLPLRFDGFVKMTVAVRTPELVLCNLTPGRCVSPGHWQA